MSICKVCSNKVIFQIVYRLFCWLTNSREPPYKNQIDLLFLLFLLCFVFSWNYFFIQRVIFVYIILSSRWKIFIFPFLSHLVKSNIKLYGKWLEFKWSEYVYPHHALQIKAHHSGKKPVSLLIAVSRLVNTKKTYRESAKQHWINQINGNHLN